MCAAEPHSRHWMLPPDDADYSLRWRLIKTKFSAHFPSCRKPVRQQTAAARTRYLATAFLRTHRARQNRFAALRGLHPFQSRQTWIVRQCPRLGVFVVSLLCARRMAAVKLGRKKRNGGNEFWRVNAIKTYPPRAVRTQVGFKSSVGLGTNKSAQFKLNNKNQYILYIYIINYFKGRLKTNFEFSETFTNFGQRIRLFKS